MAINHSLRHLFRQSDSIKETTKIYAEKVSEAILNIRATPDALDDEDFGAEFGVMFDDILEYQRQNNLCFICDTLVLQKLGKLPQWYSHINQHTEMIIEYNNDMSPQDFLYLLAQSKETLIRLPVRDGKINNGINQIHDYIGYVTEQIELGEWV